MSCGRAAIGAAPPNSCSLLGIAAGDDHHENPYRRREFLHPPGAVAKQAPGKPGHLLNWTAIVPGLSSPDGSYTLTAPKQLLPVTRHLSYRLTPLIYRLPLTPNQITALSMAAGLAGAWCFSLGTPDWGIIGSLLLVACYTLDNCDGEIARLKDI